MKKRHELLTTLLSVMKLINRRTKLKTSMSKKIERRGRERWDKLSGTDPQLSQQASVMLF